MKLKIVFLVVVAVLVAPMLYGQQRGNANALFNGIQSEIFKVKDPTLRANLHIITDIYFKIGSKYPKLASVAMTTNRYILTKLQKAHDRDRAANEIVFAHYDIIDKGTLTLDAGDPSSPARQWISFDVDTLKPIVSN